ncbi:MAG: hypothetical protein ABIY51_02940 [Ferruginibacter sp.]
MKLSTALSFFILLFIANAVVFFKRDEFLFTKQVSYADLYPKIVADPIKEIKKINDSTLQFELINPVAGNVTWFLKEGDQTDSFKAVHPEIKAGIGLRSYMLSSPFYKDSILARIEYVPAVASKNQSPGLFLYRMNASSKTFADVLDQKYINDYLSISPEQRSDLLKIIADSVGINAGMGTVEKVKKICRYMGKKIRGTGNKVDDSVLALNPFKQFEAACTNKVVDCGVYVRIFDLFASAAGVKSRMVEMRSKPKNVAGSVHEFNEYFIPETSEWAAADLTFKIAASYNASGKLLNAVELKNNAPNDSSVIMLLAGSDSLTQKSFAEMGDVFFDLYGREKDLYFYETTADRYNGNAVKRIKNFILPVHWYTIYSDTHIIDNRNYYIKALLLLLLLASIMYLGFSLLLRKNYKKYDRI